METQDSANKTTGFNDESSQARKGTDPGTPFDQTIDAPSPIAVPDSLVRTVVEFTSLLSHSGLMSADEIELFVQGHGSEAAKENADELAAALVETHKLTPFQLDQLKQGKSDMLVLGNYVVLEKIGAGGMGVVFKARHQRMKREVALKVLPETLTDSPDALARFHREVEASAKLQHPNIASAFDADESHGIHFLVMEFIDGPDLSHYVKQFGPLPVPYAVSICLQIAKGLKHAHDSGVVHRDIKPSNLLVDSRGTLKILDMGLAHLTAEASDTEGNAADLTQSGRVMGTVDYMAPEQAVDAKRADARADIYSLGCTLYYLVTGHPVFPEGSMTQKLLCHQSNTVAPLSDACEGTTEMLDAVFSKMLAKKPGDRQQSMDGLIVQLDAVLSEMPHTGEATLPKLAGPLEGVEISPSIGGLSAADRTTLAAGLTSALPQKKTSPVKAIVGVALLIGLLLGGAGIMGLFGDRNNDANAGDSASGDNAGGEGVPAADGSGVTPAVVAEKKVDERKESLRWIFAHGGSVSLVVSDGLTADPVSRVEDLPDTKFEVRGVQLAGTVLEEKQLALLGKMTSLEELSLARTKLSDASLASLSTLKQLWSLDLSQTQVGDTGVKHLTRLTDLRDLNLSGTKITDNALPQVSQLPKLEKIFLADTSIGDKALSSLYGLAALKYVSLNNTKVTVDGYRDLSTALKKLEIAWDGPDLERVAARKLLDKGAVIILEVIGDKKTVQVHRRADLPAVKFHVTTIDFSGNPSIGDRDLLQLADLHHVKVARFDGTSVTDEGLLKLKSLASLREIDLGSLQVANVTVETLQRSLPDCSIEQKKTDERGAAKWVIASGGRVSVATPDGDLLTDLDDSLDLPQGPFVLRAVQLVGKSEIGDEQLMRFRGLSKLERLLLARTSVTDKGIVHLLGCTGLRDVDLSDTKITDAGVKRLARLRSLRQLHLAGTQLTAQGLRSLMRLPALTHLSLARTKVIDEDLVVLKGVSKLTWLSLSGTPSTDAALDPIRSLKSLKNLFVDGSSLTDAGVEELRAALPNCQVVADPPDAQRLAARWVLQKRGLVSLQSASGIVSLQRIADLPRDACGVHAIDLSSLEDVDSRGLASIAACRDLVDLNLSETAVSDQALATVAKLSNLKRLSLSGTRITDVGLVHLASLTKLESLDLGSTRISGKGLVHLGSLTSLRELMLDDCRVKNSSLGYLASNAAIEVLSLNNNVLLSDAGIARLKGLSELTRLDLGGTKATDASLETIAELKKLQRLDLSRTKLTNAGAQRLVDLKKLVQLRLDGTEITDSAMNAVSEIETLRRLDVRRTRVTKGSVDQLKTAHPQLRIQMSSRPRRNEDEQRSDRPPGPVGAGGR